MSAQKTRRGLLSALLVVVAVVVSACAPELPKTPRPVQAKAQAVVTEEQEERIREAIKVAFTAGDEAGSVEPIAARITGPASEIRHAQYVVSAANGDPAMRDPLNFASKIQIVAASDQWPRFYYVITEVPADAKAPFLMVVKQETARENYKLWGWSRMLRTDATPQVKEGAAILTPDATGLLVTPAAVVAQYADVRQNRDASPYVGGFVPDKMRADLDPAADLFAQDIAAFGTTTNTFVPEGDTFAIETKDGGAWVVGLIRNDFVSTVTVPGATLKVSQPASKGLNPIEAFATAVTVTSKEIMSFYVPPEGATEQIAVLAGQHSTVAVTGE